MPIKMINLHHLRDSKTLKIAPKLLRVEQKEFSSVLLEVSSTTTKCSFSDEF